MGNGSPVCLDAARGIGDRDAEGWALHEAGTREMMLSASQGLLACSSGRPARCDKTSTTRLPWP